MEPGTGLSCVWLHVCMFTVPLSSFSVIRLLALTVAFAVVLLDFLVCTPWVLVCDSDTNLMCGWAFSGMCSHWLMTFWVTAHSPVWRRLERCLFDLWKSVFDWNLIEWIRRLLIFGSRILNFVTDGRVGSGEWQCWPTACISLVTTATPFLLDY